MPMPAPAGNAAVPQRHEQAHWPPAPPLITEPVCAGGGAARFASEGAEAATGEADAAVGGAL